MRNIKFISILLTSFFFSFVLQAQVLPTNVCNNLNVFYENKILVKNGVLFQRAGFNIYVNGILLRKKNDLVKIKDSTYNICISRKNYNLLCYENCKSLTFIKIKRTTLSVKNFGLLMQLLLKINYYSRPNFNVYINKTFMGSRSLNYEGQHIRAQIKS